MAKRVSGRLITLIHAAAVSSFWRKKALSRFLRGVGITESFLATWTDGESKREFLDRLFLKLPAQAKGQPLLLQMARELAAQDSFPDLRGWEDSELKIAEATRAVKALRIATEKVERDLDADRTTSESRAALTRIQTESKLREVELQRFTRRLQELSIQLGTQQAGYAFQDWFHELMEFFEVVNRRPYKAQQREIDGSITIGGTTYLVETKFTTEQAAVGDVDSFVNKVRDKADNTMGVMVSISGYSATSIAQASRPGTKILLLDHRHIYVALTGAATFPEIIERARRHASQTGEAYLSPSDLGA